MEGSDRSGRSPSGSNAVKYRFAWLRLLETDLDRKDKFTKIFQFIFPWAVLLFVAITSVLYLMAWKGWDVAKYLLDIWIFYTLPPAGKETVIPKAVIGDPSTGGVPPWMAGPATTVVDLCVSLFLIWNYDWVKRIPILGPALERTEAKGRERVERTRWFKRSTFFVCTLVVFVPFSGSGGFGGTIFGRVLGMNPYMVLLAVAIGSLIGSTFFALLSEKLVQFLEGTPFLEFMTNLNMIQLVVVIIAIIFIIYTVRNPRMAAVKTTRVVSQALDVTEKGLILADDTRKKMTQGTARKTKDTLVAVGEVNRAFTEINMEIITKPIELMGYTGRKVAATMRRFTRRKVDNAHKKAGKALNHTIDMGEKATIKTGDAIGSLTLGGVGQTKKGWSGAEKAIIKGGEKVEKLVKKKKKDENSSEEE